MATGEYLFPLLHYISFSYPKQLIRRSVFNYEDTHSKKQDPTSMLAFKYEKPHATYRCQFKVKSGVLCQSATEFVYTFCCPDMNRELVLPF